MNRKRIGQKFLAFFAAAFVLSAAGAFIPHGFAHVAYAQESFDEQEIWEDIERQLEAGTAKVDIKKYGLSSSDFQKLWLNKINLSPEMYFVGTQTKIIIDAKTKVVREFVPQYLKGIDKKKLQAELNKMMSVLEEDMSDLEKALAIHDYLIAQCTYDKSANPNNLSCTSFSMYGAVANKKAVCQGYALTFLYAMKQEGIECTVVTGGNHAWNQVKIDGSWYHVDCTWDDPEGSKAGYVSHKYFLKDDAFMRSKAGGSAHVWAADKFTACTSNIYNSSNIWDNTNNQMLYKDGYWYYTRHKDNTNYDYYYKCNLKTNQEYEIKQLKNIWFASGNTGKYYPDATKIATDGKNIYYSTPNSIRVMNFNGSSDKALVTLNGSYGKIYGLNYVNGRLQYDLSTSSSAGMASMTRIYTPAEFTFFTAKSGVGAAVSYRSGKASVAGVQAGGKLRAYGIGSSVITIQTGAVGVYPATVTSANLVIGKNTVSKAKVKGLKTMAYTGKSIKPSIRVYVGGYKLPSGAYTVKYSSNKNIGTAKITVTGKGCYTGKRTVSFKIKLGKAKLSSVKSQKKAVTVRWKSVAGASGYQIYRASSPNGKYKRIETVKGKSKVSKKVQAKSKKRYYYKVRAYKVVKGGNVYGSFSGKLSAKAK